MDIAKIIMLVTGGLVLFIYAVTMLGRTIKNMAGDKTQYWVGKFTTNTISAVLTGVIITILLDSSSAVIIIAIVLVNSGVLKLRQAMGIVLGANIGTTFSSQIIAMDVGKYSPVFLFLGLVLMFASKNKNISNTGRTLLFFGMLFFGLFTMENAVEPLKNHEKFTEWMSRLDDPITGALTGAFVTLIIQSSSATVGMAITLAKKGLIELSAGIAVMLGAELGTCSDTLIATIKGSRQALKTGIFHVTFNLISIILGLIMFYPFMSLIETISDGAKLERQIANAHMIFNTLGVLMFVFLIPTAEKLLNKILPDKQTAYIQLAEEVKEESAFDDIEVN
ncbi:MAG: Na/Pi cotransporter family protein [Bacteroidia bacterium]